MMEDSAQVQTPNIIRCIKKRLIPFGIAPRSIGMTYPLKFHSINGLTRKPKRTMKLKKNLLFMAEAWVMISVWLKTLIKTHVQHLGNFRRIRPPRFHPLLTDPVLSPGHFQDQPAVGQVVSVLPVALPTVLIGKTIYLNEVKLPTKAKTLAIVL
jgi:hypothetical protein